jgi:hypothetical protein
MGEWYLLKFIYIENGDYTVYNNVDFGSGPKSFQARVASATSGGNIEVRIDSITGPVIGTYQVTSSGNWKEYTDVKRNISKVSGAQPIFKIYRWKRILV